MDLCWVLHFFIVVPAKFNFLQTSWFFWIHIALYSSSMSLGRQLPTRSLSLFCFDLRCLLFNCSVSFVVFFVWVFFVIFLSQFFSMVFYVAFIWLCFLLQIIFLVATPQFQSFKHFCQFVIIIKATLNFLNIKLFVSLDHGVLCMSSSLHCCPLVNANFFSFQASHVCILLSYF